ncbi:MAG: hypothetical protein FWE05_04330 [Defluviitaleaceae bacterium]|nr:hypothetical protein [Defluviitaleaceae bacterium]
MADSYIANEAEIKDIRKRRTDVKTREDNAGTRETKVTRREKAIKGKETLLATATTVKNERDELQAEVDKQAREIEALTAKSANIGRNLVQAYDTMTAAIEAVQVLKYTVTDRADLDEYKADNLNPKQGTLIDALAEYGAKSAEKIGLTKHANRMRTAADVNKDILAEMKALNPQLFPQVRNRSIEIGGR